MYTYDAASRRTQMQASGLPPVTYAYDANSRLTALAQGPQTAGLAYDAANRRSTLTLPNGIVVEYVYDLGSRLSAQIYRNAAGVLGDLTYQYDANGNRIGTGGSFARSLVPAAIGTTSYDQANQQLAFGTVSQTFDNNGNLLTQTDASGTTSYTWDARNRLAAISGPTTSAAFAYDALGRRIGRTINGVTTTYQYDGLDAIRESGGAGDATYLRTLAIDEALTRTEGDATVAYVGDILGSTVALADASGAPVTTYTYAPFGETSVSGTPSPNPFRFTGREQDLPGLYYYRARYYDPTRSRFVSEDPIGVTGGINVFRYVGNSPLTRSDPTGLRCAYSQGTGSMVCTDEQTGHVYYSATGYSGTGQGRNNPELQNLQNVGPVPRGEWEASGAWYTSPNTGPNTIRLTPRTQNECSSTARDCQSFRIHGNNSINDASRGCIVLPPNRTAIPPGEIIEVVQ